MSVKPFEIVEFGGVDSRSNPVNMPRNRALRCLNWVPKQDGHLELRYGYSTESMSTISAVAIHSLFSYQSWDATKKYLLVAQGTALSVHDLSAQTDTAGTIRGAAIASSSRWGSYFANNRLHIGNGTNQKFFDGTTFRDNGLRAPTAAEVANVVVYESVRELTSAENSTITLTVGTTGSFSTTSLTGYLFFVHFFNVSDNELGPATVMAGTGRVVVTGTGKKITVGNMPVPTNGNWAKLISRTADAGSVAYFCTDTSTAVTSCTRSGVTITIISTAHGLSGGDVIRLSGSTNFDGLYVVNVVDANTIQVTLGFAAGANTTGGTIKRIVKAANATTSVDVTSTAQDLTFVTNSSIGIPASAIGGANPGYQFYAAIYNPITGHVGNRIAIGGRYAPTNRVNLILVGLPDYSGVDSEWQLVIGRTGDGAAVPYVVTDASGNWTVALSGQTQVIINEANTDGNFELPTRNGIIPSQCTMLAHVGDYIYAADPSSPTIRRSASQQNFNTGIFMGRPEQSWAGNDIDTFPTAEAVRGIAEDDLELFVGTQNDCAVLSDQNGQPMWRGPWNVGLAGPRAMVKAKPYGFFWLSASKQLCTFVNGMPTPVSDEYEQSELFQIGDAFLQTAELVYYRDAAIGKDEIRVEAKKQDGTPITIIHDFKPRDERSPFGQGYSAQFQGPLAIAFTAAMARDANGRPKIYAGGSTGQLYLLYSGADDAGSSYDADAIYLVNSGTERPDLPFIDWIGDENSQISIGKTLSTSLDTAAEFQFDLLNPTSGLPQAVPGAENDSVWRVFLDAPEIQTHLYVRFQLTSHSADGDLSLNSPPHVPLESYGRIYEIIPVEAGSRGR